MAAWRSQIIYCLGFKCLRRTENPTQNKPEEQHYFGNLMREDSLLMEESRHILYCSGIFDSTVVDLSNTRDIKFIRNHIEFPARCFNSY